MRLHNVLVAAFACFGCISSQFLDGEQLPVQRADPSRLSPSTTYDTFVNHFSAQRAGTGTYLHSRLIDLYPNETITVTTDPYFLPMAYASLTASHSDTVPQHDAVIREMDDVQALKKIVFAPAARRRDGNGKVFESVSFAGYEIGYMSWELKAFVASWMEGYQLVTQWLLIGDSGGAQKFVHECAAWSAQIREAVLVFDQSFWRPDHELWRAVQKASWTDVILEQSFKDNLVNDYRSFFKSEEIYKKLTIPWKRGLIFLGPPGNGKTISLKAIMHDAQVPILYVKSFHTYGGDELGIRMIFERARAEAPCILVLEDLDSLITDLNRSFFLNEVDGLEDNDGLLLIGTTNHFDRLDPALSNRPSRFDRKYNFPNPSRDERRQYAVFWQQKLAFNDDIDYPDSLLDKVADKSDHFSFAYLQEAFVSTLLTLAGIDDPSDRPAFETILLQQIKHLQDQLAVGGGTGMAESWLMSASAVGGEERRSVRTGMRKFGGEGGNEVCVQVPVGQRSFGL